MKDGEFAEEWLAGRSKLTAEQAADTLAGMVIALARDNEKLREQLRAVSFQA